MNLELVLVRPRQQVKRQKSSASTFSLRNFDKMRFTTKVLPSRSGNLGILELNHPKALHALSMDMIECIQDVMSQWTSDVSMKAILFKANNAESKRLAFCAGGDVKAVWESGMAKDPLTPNFFYQEYQVNYSIATCPKPIVSIWDGVVMGGGVGLSVHGKYRVATENTLFAMPETSIGLFPDVGSMYWMPRLLSPSVANYLALTGHRVTAADLVYTGIATHYIPSEKLPELESALIEATKEGDNDPKTHDVIANVLKSFHEKLPPDDCHVLRHKSTIEWVFQGETIEEIIEKLEEIQKEEAESDDAFAEKALATLKKVSPTSLKVTLEGLKRGAVTKSIAEDLQMEYRMARACTLPGADFFEGVRALLVDKDHSPKWNPSTIEEVTSEQVQEFFAPIEHEWSMPSSKL